jgi:predicted amidohydrolase YtcJ
MPDGRLLNRDDLDKALPDNPVLVGHVSMHGAVLNSAAMKKWGISAKTKTPPGGVIVRKPGTQEPYGLIMEIADLPSSRRCRSPRRSRRSSGPRRASCCTHSTG